MFGLRGRVFVTGGAGYLAKAIYRRAAAEQWGCEFTAFSRDDNKHIALRRRWPEVRCIRGDICADRALMRAAMAGHDLVIHAAAEKHVDLSEYTPISTARTNIEGSLNVLLAAAEAGVRQVVGISTDKACQPVNVYGCTKMVMERMFIEADERFGDLETSVCRYGNVLASTGSVIPRFRRQLADTGRIEVTDPQMSRFWMSADEAVHTVIVASRVSGCIIVPKMRAARLSTLANTAHDGAPMVITGLRPGEKMDETVLHLQESPRAGEWFVGDDPAKPSWDGWRIEGPTVRLSPMPQTLAFEVKSSTPPLGWLGREELLEILADSAELE